MKMSNHMVDKFNYTSTDVKTVKWVYISAMAYARRGKTFVSIAQESIGVTY